MLAAVSARDDRVTTFKSLAKSIGVLLSRRHSSRSWEWNGTSLALMEARERERCQRSLIHDLCHWMTCTPMRRARNEFGLGTSPGNAQPARRSVSKIDAQHEEEAVCILSCLVERLLEFDDGGPDGPFYFYSMEHASIKTLACWRLLERRGALKALEGSFSEEEIRRESARVLRRCRTILSEWSTRIGGQQIS